MELGGAGKHYQSFEIESSQKISRLFSFSSKFDTSFKAILCSVSPWNILPKEILSFSRRIVKVKF